MVTAGPFTGSGGARLHPGVYARGVSSEDPARDRDLDRAWQEIVDHYGERAEVEAAAEPEPAPAAAGPDPYAVDVPAAEPEPTEERYVPPPPPPLPHVEPKRRLAWTGLFGAPLVLLVFTVTGWDLPRLLAYALVAAFVGGFVYLVAAMPRGPRDPGDDGARI